MKRLINNLLIAILILLTSSQIYAQIATGYQVATWYDFKTAAVSYTFDDNTAKQITVAIPMFDNYGFHATFNPVINWGPNWTEFSKAAANGHEIGSHTVTHATLSNISTTEQNTECANSQSTINQKISPQKCVTIAYPNCNTGDVPTISKYYIAGRICDNQIISNNTTNYYNLSSIICGSEGINTAQGFNDKVALAKNSGGWCVFLMHGLDNDPGFSPTNSSELNSHLGNINNNKSTYWVETFGNVAKYLRERQNLSISETPVNDDSIKVTITDNLPNDIYNFPITIRRKIPANWDGIRVINNNSIVETRSETINNEEYVIFNIAPDSGETTISNTKPIVKEPIQLYAGWNLIGSPLKQSTDIETALQSIWNDVEFIKNDSLYYSKNGASQFNLLQTIEYSKGYEIKVTADCSFTW